MANGPGGGILTESISLRTHRRIELPPPPPPSKNIENCALVNFYFFHVRDPRRMGIGSIPKFIKI